MNTALDLRTIDIPTELLVDGHDLAPELLRFLDLTVDTWTTEGVLSARKGYGLAVSNVVPVGSLLRVDWDDPEALLGFGIAAHDAAPHYPWNALRKMRMLARARAGGLAVTSSLELAVTYPGFVLEPITKDERPVEKAGGLIRWGDFPYGGAVYRTDGVREVMAGLSVWTQQEDHRVVGPVADYLLELAAGT